MTTTSIIPSNLSSYTTGGVTGLNSSIGTSGVSGVTSGILGLNLSSSASTHGLANYDTTILTGLGSSGIGGGGGTSLGGIGSGGTTGGTSGTGATSISATAAGVNISPLPLRANQINSSLPPICQV